MAECDCIQGCPFFNGKMAIAMPTIVEGLKKKFCLGDNTNCARHQVKEALGKAAVPPELLPTDNKTAQEIINRQSIRV